MYERTNEHLPYGIVGYRRLTFVRRVKWFLHDLFIWLGQPRP